MAAETFWVVDWKRVSTVADIVALLSACDLRPRPAHPDFEIFKHLCKQIDGDGREVQPTPTINPEAN